MCSSDIDRHRSAGGEPKGTLNQTEARKSIWAYRSKSFRAIWGDGILNRKIETVGQTGKKGLRCFITKKSSARGLWRRETSGDAETRLEAGPKGSAEEEPETRVSCAASALTNRRRKAPRFGEEAKHPQGKAATPSDAERESCSEGWDTQVGQTTCRYDRETGGASSGNGE